MCRGIPKKILDFHQKHVNIVFDYLKQWPEDIQLKDLTLKLTMLLALLTGQRCQTLHLLNIDNMQLLKDKCIFYVNIVVKQTSARKHVKPLELLSYVNDKQLCVIHCIEQYLKITSDIRGGTKQLLISLSKPHKAVSKDIIGKWIRLVFKRCNIDIRSYGAHSTRAASTSIAIKRLPVFEILKKCWLE